MVDNMKTQFVLGLLLGVAAAACGGSVGAELDAASVEGAALGSGAPDLAPTSAYGGPLRVAGRLDGQLKGMELAGETADNAGSFEVWEHGGGRTELDIAASGMPAGAAMLMVTFLGTALEDTLEAGSSTVEQGAPSDVSSITTVTSCAGPTMGEWPDELPAVSAEISAVNDPERPNGVLVTVKGRFAASHLGPDATSELVGIYRFDRF
jgi:hypothetical protein